MKKPYLSYAVLVLFLVFFYIYFTASFQGRFDNIFLTISTFTFAIFTGFFISRQGNRQAAVRDNITDFDGILSFFYRASGHFTLGRQQKMGQIISNHYKEEAASKNWAYYFTRKSTLITDLHKELEDIMNAEDLSKKGHVVNRMLQGLSDAQKLRKSLVALNEERIPASQWLLISILGLILLVTVSLLPSQGEMLASSLKAAFSTAVVFVLIVLLQFDNLSFFEKTIGEHSERDLLEIIEGKK